MAYFIQFFFNSQLFVHFFAIFEKNIFASASSEICERFEDWLLIGQSTLVAFLFTDNMDFILSLGLALQALTIDGKHLFSYNSDPSEPVAINVL